MIKHIEGSVTRFGEILKVFGQFLEGLLNIPKILNLFGQILIVANGQTLKK